VYFYRVAQKLKSVDDIYKWADHLGLGKKTGINLAREVPGLIPSEAWKMKRFGQIWNAGETLSVAIGQSFVLTTAIQLANLYASIANGGTVYKPFVVKATESWDGKTLVDTKPEVVYQTRLSPKTYQLIKEGLWGVVNTPHGTAYSQRLPGMDFVGKTGSAQVIRISADKIYGKCENMRFRDRQDALFAGYAPADNPTIAVAVIAEHACHGASGAAPIARAVVKAYLEKYYPELYGEKVLAEKLKQKGLSQVVNRVHTPEEEDTATDINNENLPDTNENTIPLPPPLKTEPGAVCQCSTQ
jgi:penicillin-binding protein 2